MLLEHGTACQATWNFHWIQDIAVLCNTHLKEFVKCLFSNIVSVYEKGKTHNWTCLNVFWEIFQKHYVVGCDLTKVNRMLQFKEEIHWESFKKVQLENIAIQLT